MYILVIDFVRGWLAWVLAHWASILLKLLAQQENLLVPAGLLDRTFYEPCSLENSHMSNSSFCAEICSVRCCRFNLRSHQLDMARAGRKKWVKFVPLCFSITPQTKQLSVLSGPGTCSWCAKESSWRNRLWTDSKDHVGWSKPSERCPTSRGETTIDFHDGIKLFYNCNTNLACHTRLSEREWALLD